MGFIERINRGIPRLDVWDISLTKLAVFAVTLMLVTWWPQLASLPWFVYLLVAILAAWRPTSKMLA